MKFQGGREGAWNGYDCIQVDLKCCPKIHFYLFRNETFFCIPQSASGVLKGFDPLLNLVLDGTIEYMRGKLAVHPCYVKRCYRSALAQTCCFTGSNI